MVIHRAHLYISTDWLWRISSKYARNLTHHETLLSLSTSLLLSCHWTIEFGQNKITHGVYFVRVIVSSHPNRTLFSLIDIELMSAKYCFHRNFMRSKTKCTHIFSLSVPIFFDEISRIFGHYKNANEWDQGPKSKANRMTFLDRIEKRAQKEEEQQQKIWSHLKCEQFMRLHKCMCRMGRV